MPIEPLDLLAEAMDRCTAQQALVERQASRGEDCTAAKRDLAWMALRLQLMANV